MQIEYPSNFLKAQIRTAATLSEGSFNAKFTFTVILARIDRPMNALRLCCRQFSHKVTL